MRSTLPQCSHITRKRGVFYWRKRLPHPQRGEVTVSLRTRNYRQAEHRAGILTRAFEGALTRAMGDVAGDKAKLNAILRDYMRAYVEGGAVPLPMWPPNELSALLDDAASALADRDPKNRRSEIEGLMQHHGLPEDMRPMLALGVLEAEVFALRKLVGDAAAGRPVVFTPGGFDVKEAVPPTAPEPPAKPTVSALLSAHFKRRETKEKATLQVIGQERGTLRRFVEVCGDRPIDAFNRGDVTRFLETLGKLPATYGKSKADKDRSLEAIIAEADTTGAERLKEKTLKRHLTALTALFRYARDEGHITNAQRSELVDDRRFRIETAAREQRDTWTVEELKTLFTSPVWTGCHPYFRTKAGPTIIRDGKFWLPLLALFHGSRLEELADLYRRDLFNEGDTWALRFTETEDRRLKTMSARRVLPLHPEAIRMGFLRYVNETAKAPNDPLFPDLEPQGPDRKRGTGVEVAPLSWTVCG